MPSQTSAPVDFSRFENVIGDSLRGSKTLHQGINPSDKTRLWDVPVATAEDLDDAVSAAQQSFRSWSKVSWEARQELVGKLRDSLLQHQEALANILVREGGKPVSFWYRS